MRTDTPGNHGLDAEDFRKASGWLITLSIALIVLGAIAIIWPGIASGTFTLAVAWILLVCGAVRMVKAFQSKPVRSFWLNLVVGVLYAIAGLYMLINLPAGVAALTLALGILFIVEGIFTVVAAFRNHIGGNLSWIVVLDGVITLILGILAINQWPASAFWLIGLYLGISLLSSGIALLSVTLATRNAMTSHA